MGVDIGINVGTASISGVFSGAMRTASGRVANLEGELAPALTACLEDGAGRLGYPSARAMLRETGSVVISVPAVGALMAAPEAGPKMGLLVSKGLEEEILAGPGSGRHAAAATIHSEMIESVDEEIDPSGRAMREPQVEDVREAVRRLLQKGAEAIVVGLRRSPMNPARETKIREMIEHEYPAHYLGAVPVVLSADHGVTLDDAVRTSAALLNAACTAATAKLLYEAEDVLRDRGFGGVMRVLDAMGGSARVCKSVPSSCIGSDLAADSNISGEIAARRGLSDVVIIDMGARDARVGSLVDGSLVPAYRHVGLGSHSVLLPDDGGHVVIGATCARPACHALGDEEPTLTDAFVLLGLIDSDILARSSATSGREHARRAIESGVACHLGISADAVAALAVAQAVQSIAAAVREEMFSRGMEGAGVSLIALGGASGVICGDVARELGVKEVCSPISGWASGAAGAVRAPVQHSHAVHAGRLLGSDVSSADREWYDEAVHLLEERAVQGMRGEGLSVDELSFDLELEVGIGGAVSTIPAPRSLGTQEDVLALFGALGDPASGGDPVAGDAPATELDIRSFILRATGLVRSSLPYAAAESVIAEGAAGGGATSDPAGARVGRREAVLDGVSTTVDVFHRESLRPGDRVEGPAVIESRGDVFVVPDGMAFAVDDHLVGTVGSSRAAVGAGLPTANARA